MFYIRVNSTYVDLPADFKIDLIIENPLFLQDRVTLPYTTSAEFPLTPGNKRLLNEPNRVNKIDRTWEFDGTVMGYGARVLYYGMLIVQEIGGMLKWNFQASDDLSNIKKNMNDIDWGQILFGSAIDGYADNYINRTEPAWGDEPPLFYGTFPATYYKSVWESVRDDEADYTIGAIKTAEEQIPTIFNSSDELVYVNALFGQNGFFNPSGNYYGLIMAKEYDPITGIASRKSHSPMFPQLRAYYFFKQLLGLTDDRNPFSSPDLRKVVMTSHFHPNLRDDLVQKWAGIILDNAYPASASASEGWFLKLASYQPASSASEVMKSLMNLVCATLFRNQSASEAYFELKLNRDIIADTSFINWDAQLGTKLIISRESPQTYVYGYNDYDEDEAPVAPEFILTTIEALIAAPVELETGEQVYFIQTTGQLILKKLSPKAEASDPDVFTYEVKHSGLNGSSGASGFDIRSALAPMKMKPTVNLDELFNTIARPSTLAYMPIYSGEKSKSYTPHFMLYWGNRNNPLNGILNMPHLSYHNYDAAGDRMGDISLQWNGPDGLIENYHKYFKEWVESSRLKAYGEFILSPHFLKDLDLSKKVLVRGKLWWIQKIQVGMSRKKIEPARVDLIEAPVPPILASGGSGSGSAPAGSGSGGGGIPASGTCYTITIDTTTFNPETDYFNITLQRPGVAQSTAGYDSFASFDSGTDTMIAVCSEAAPIFTQSGSVVASVRGVSITTGGSCSVDGDCVL